MCSNQPIMCVRVEFWIKKKHKINKNFVAIKSYEKIYKFENDEYDAAKCEQIFVRLILKCLKKIF